MWTHSQIDKQVTRRWKKLGDVGEDIARVLLKSKGFKNIYDLNEIRENQSYADIYAERYDQAYVISVKTRNKYEASGRLNSRYKLGRECYQKAKEVENEYNAVAAWIAVSLNIEAQTCAAYFGRLSQLKGNTGILMTQNAVGEYECLASCHLRDLGFKKETFVDLKNLYKKKTQGRQA